MASPSIAIVGSFDPARKDELGLKNLALGNKAGEDLGRELAKQGFSLVVYSSDPHTLEVDVVRGYLSEKDVKPGSIQVLYSQESAQPAFAQEAGNEDKFDYRPDFNPDWEFSFYQSLARIDGLLILGGGSWALIGGVVAISHRKPILACAGFGGSGDKIWRAIRAQEYPLTDEEFGLMARANWSGDLAARLVGLLKKEQEGFASREAERLANEEKRVQEARLQALKENSTINWHAVISALLFAAAIFTWPLANYLDAGKFSFFTLCIALFAPIIAGASGATIRVVLDWATGVTRTFTLSTYNQYILLRYAALGIVAGGLAGISFVLAQIFSSPEKPALSKLVPFLVIIGFAAGLAAEVVLSNLRKSGTTIEIPLAPPNPSSTQSR